MINKFVEIWDKHKQEIEEIYRAKHPNNYKEVVENVVKLLNKYDFGYDKISTKIHCIDDGDYQGTLLFLIPKDTYQPYEYYYVMVGYGSCSGCDTLEAIRNYDYENAPTEAQVKSYMTLSIHIIQGLKEID